MPNLVSLVDGIWQRATANAREPFGLTPNPCLAPNVPYLGVLGQSGNSIAGNIANQAVGTSGQIPALAAAAVSTLTVANTLVTASSLIFCQVAKGTTTPAANTAVEVTVTTLTAATSFTVAVRNNGTAATLVTDYVFWYLIVN